MQPMLELDTLAVRSFNTKKHLYLTVIDEGSSIHLEVRSRSWLGRLWMWLGWSNSSMSKVIEYVHRNQEQFRSLDSNLKSKLLIKVSKYQRAHSLSIPNLKDVLDSQESSSTQKLPPLANKQASSVTNVSSSEREVKEKFVKDVPFDDFAAAFKDFGVSFEGFDDPFKDFVKESVKSPKETTKTQSASDELRKKVVNLILEKKFEDAANLAKTTNDPALLNYVEARKREVEAIRLIEGGHPEAALPLIKKINAGGVKDDILKKAIVTLTEKNFLKEAVELLDEPLYSPFSNEKLIKIMARTLGIRESMFEENNRIAIGDYLLEKKEYALAAKIVEGMPNSNWGKRTLLDKVAPHL
jgi:hypothetical protein